MTKLCFSSQVSEWYSCRWDCPATYEITAELLDAKNKVVRSFEKEVSIKNMDQNHWHYVRFFFVRYSSRSALLSSKHQLLLPRQISFEFTDYGPGVEKVMLYHGGSDTLFWAGHYGSKMAGSCVLVKLPDLHPPTRKIDDDDDDDERSLRPPTPI